MVRPAGAARSPAALLFHGCGGRRPFLDDYAAALAARGVASVIVDSFAARGWSRARALATVCTGVELPGHRRAGDVLATLWGVKTLPGIDASRLALAGWSHGGWSIMDLMTMALTRPGEAGLADPDPGLLSPVRALVLAYPYCGPGALSQLRPWRRAPDVLAFVGERDRVAHPALCRRAFARAGRVGARVDSWYPDATHAFDEKSGGLTPFRYDPDLALAAQDRVAAYLAERLDADSPPSD